jgi:hypothetical protein
MTKPAVVVLPKARWPMRERPSKSPLEGRFHQGEPESHIIEVQSMTRPESILAANIARYRHLLEQETNVECRAQLEDAIARDVKARERLLAERSHLPV